ncbi:D-isomer specific 2-hydroxyacid dehydrogenase [Xylariaceae sp. FL1272]|nr:D-isomer specific 2-hydroxyacid dehydrogenase [Xylariaceae sp. FL1272]
MDAPLKLPHKYPSPTHDVIVVLEEVHLSIDGTIDTGSRTNELISYHRISKPDEVRDRIQCASIVVATQSFITPESLGEAPYLRCIITPTAGINHVDLNECRRRGIRVAKCEGLTSLAVPDHALSLYFAARRKTVLLHNDIRAVDADGTNSWKRQHSLAFKMQTANGHPPCSIDEEIAGIIGYGFIGKRLSELCQRLGMTVIVSERKGASSIREADNSVTRKLFDEVIGQATVLFICCPSSPDTEGMIAKAELDRMRPEVVLVNVSRGNVMNTAATIEALRSHRISGAAVDVFDSEPASTVRDSAFLNPDTRDLNLTFSPHVGYFSTKTIATVKTMVKTHIKDYASGDFGAFVV